MPVTPKFTIDGRQVVFGLQDVRKKLEAIPERVRRNVIRRGMLEGMGIIRARARELVPQPPATSKSGNIRTGALKRRIVAQTRGVQRDRDGKPTLFVGVVQVRRKRKGEKGRNPRTYAHLVEFGVKPKMRNGKIHPGSPAQPFLRPAFEEKGQEALDAMMRRILSDLEMELAKLRNTGDRSGGRAA